MADPDERLYLGGYADFLRGLDAGFQRALESGMSPDHVARLRATNARLRRVVEKLGADVGTHILLDCLDEAISTGVPIQGLLESALDLIEHA